MLVGHVGFLSNPLLVLSDWGFYVLVCSTEQELATVYLLDWSCQALRVAVVLHCITTKRNCGLRTSVSCVRVLYVDDFGLLSNIVPSCSQTLNLSINYSGLVPVWDCFSFYTRTSLLCHLINCSLRWGRLATASSTFGQSGTATGE